MKIYRESLKTISITAAILALVTSFFLYFREQLYELLEVSWYLTVGETKEVASPNDRYAYLQAHPTEIKLAMIGDWKQAYRSGRPRQNILTIAIRRINQEGGINGRIIIPDWMDIHGSADKLHEYVEKIARDPSYFAMVGPSTSGQLLSVKPLLLTYKILTIAPSISNVNAAMPDEPPYIFLPNSSDEQDVAALCEWAAQNDYSDFILINENQPFSAGYAKQIERLFFERSIMISARTFFNPSDNINFFMNEMKNYADFFNIRNALIVNYSAVPKTYERLAKWMLTHTSGVVFSYKLLPGDFSDEEMKRMYSIVYSNKNKKMQFYINELSALPGALQDAFAPAVYQSIYLFADACRKAEKLHQNNVISVLQNQELQGPFGYFRFNENRFEKDPVIRVVPVYQLRKDWGEILMRDSKRVKQKAEPPQTSPKKESGPAAKND